MAIVAISGKKQSGKSTIARIIQYHTAKEPWQVSLEEYLTSNWLYNSPNNNWEVKLFATKLKEIVSILTGISVQDLEKEEVKQRKLEDWKVWKLDWLDSYGHGVMLFSEEHDALEEQEKMFDSGSYYSLTIDEFVPDIRHLLQYIGTDLFRNQLHPDVFCFSLFPDYIPEINESFLRMNISDCIEKNLIDLK